jgi:feruloyl esterase
LLKFQAQNATITTAEFEDAPYTLPGGGGGTGGGTKIAKSFCRVVGFLTPTSDSHIGFEVWLPAATDWNHKFEAIGNGGFTGSVNVRGMLPGFERGYATMATDYGHLNPPSNPVEDVTWAYGHPEKFIDYAYRAEHLSTVVSKQIIAAYYDAAPAHSYYTGCSGGGIHGMTEMLRYPKDYDGYIIGDGLPDHLGQEVGQFWYTMVISSLANPAEAFQPSQISLVHDAVLKQCAGKDGGVSTDAFLSKPDACKFDPKAIQCAAGQHGPDCLSAAQVEALKKIWNGPPLDPVTRKQILPPYTPGSELTWDRYISGKKNPVGTERPWAGFMANVAMADPDYLTQEKYLTFNFGTNLAAVRQRMIAGETLDAVFNTSSRDLDPVKAERGKVIQYHGWDDPNNPPLDAVGFFQSVVADQAQRHHLASQQALEETQQFYRLFMVPGMGHCAGGAGPSVFGQNGVRSTKDDAENDTLTALEVWVEMGNAPERFIGSRVDAETGSVDMTRPICAYPKVPTYTGSGSTNEAASFVCADKPQSPRVSK